MKKELVLPTGVAEGIGASIRQVAMRLSKTWRPIGISILEGSNLISVPFTYQDTIEIFSVLSSAKFIPDREIAEDLVYEDLEIGKEFRLSDLSRRLSNFKVKFENDSVILAPISTAITLRIVFLNSNGNNSEQDNREYLALTGTSFDTSGISVFSSRHTPTSNFLFKVSPDRDSFGESRDILELTLTSEVKDEELILKESIDFIVETLLNFKNSM